MDALDLEKLLTITPNVVPLASDNNDYLTSYRFDTGAEIAFDPRTTTKCSIFVDKIPERMRYKLGKINNYNPGNPSTALARVSPQIASATQLFKIDLPSIDVAKELLAWYRWHNNK